MLEISKCLPLWPSRGKILLRENVASQLLYTALTVPLTNFSAYVLQIRDKKLEFIILLLQNYCWQQCLYNIKVFCVASYFWVKTFWNTNTGWLHDYNNSFLFTFNVKVCFWDRYQDLYVVYLHSINPTDGSTSTSKYVCICYKDWRHFWVLV